MFAVSLIAAQLIAQNPSAAATSNAAPDIARHQLAKQIQQLLHDPALTGAGVGVVVRSLSRGEQLLSINPDLRCIPASNQKLLTAAAAISLLGPDFRFPTEVRKHDKRLWLVGSGDPSLTTQRLEELARDTAAALGEDRPLFLELDDTAFAGPTLGAAWQWDDESFPFSAPFSALVTDRSTATFTVTPGVVGSPANVSLPSPAGQIEGTVTTIPGNTDRVRWERKRAAASVVVSGTIGVSAPPQRIAFAIHDPTAFTGRIFAEQLAQKGVTIAPAGRSAAPAASARIAVSQSRPLRELLADFLKPSDNLAGECLLRATGRHAGGIGSDSTGIANVHKWLERVGIDHSGIDVMDGSGLSMQNTLTARFLIQLLTEMADNRAFVDALPVAGRDGTLRNRLKGTAAEGRVMAKTGTLTVSSCLSGYVVTRSGERLVFSILMNQFDRKTGSRKARQIQDAIVELLARVAPAHR